MLTHVTDSQTVYGVDGVLFSMTMQSPTPALVTIANTGTNTANYHFQEFNGNTWNDMGAIGTPLNNTVSGFQIVSVSVVSNYPQVRLNGYCNFGAQTVVEFAVDRYVERQSGGQLPILNL